MNDLPLKADPEQINAWLANAILESGLGKTIRAEAAKALNSYDFKRSVQETIRQMVLNAAREHINNDPEFTKKISEAVAKELTPEIIEKAASAGVDRLNRY